MSDQTPSTQLRSHFAPGTHARDMDLPVPQLALDFRMSVQLEPKIAVGPTPFGTRNWISFRSGKWSATWGRGTVVPGGQDNQLVTAAALSTWVETNYLLQTDDAEPAYITVKTNGWRNGPRPVIERLANPDTANDVKPDEYLFRLYVSMATGDERYRFLNERMWVASAARFGAEVMYDSYRIS